jgi:uncharacterized protein YbgA (DUF1722 family)/uncharacterized protein YbbK (DUF523 family)
VGEKIKLGISTCLLGRNVRFDGGHKLDHYLAETLGEFVEYVPVCPEVEIGFPIPRESMHLAGNPAAPRLVAPRSGLDHTDRMQAWAKVRLDALEREDLCGYVFKSGSPSSGMERVRVYNENGTPAKTGVGIFARAFMERFPLLPVEDEGRLHDPQLRENFIERVFALKRWRDLLKRRLTLGTLVKFHTAHKLQLMAHSPKHYSEMGRLLAHGGDMPLRELSETYQAQFMEALRLHATPRKNANVLLHIAGYFKRTLGADEKRELLDTIEAYRTQLVPLIVPITLASHYVRKYQEPYLKEQHFLHPHPLELRLRNHV